MNTTLCPSKGAAGLAPRVLAPRGAVSARLCSHAPRAVPGAQELATAVTEAGQQAAALAPSWASSAAVLADLDSGNSFSVGQSAATLIEEQLKTLSPVTFAALLGAGLATSLSPCTLSVLPLTIGYIGGYQTNQSAEDEEGQPPLALRATAFSLGLSSTLALLGVASTSLGKAYGQLGGGPAIPIAVSLVAIAMGLNLLEVVTIQLPSVDVDVRKAGLGPLPTSYLAGLTFALAASPCSTPVLATILAYVSTLDNPLVGGGLLLTYTTGYVAPLLFAATATEALGKVMSMRESSAWITPASGALLIAGGSYTLASRLL
ncbi:unnamed protein product [Pedinophyceae sp. YPF-701]|nr:unnamed protein product [Pedinophyceae sp. YPF-701]